MSCVFNDIMAESLSTYVGEMKFPHKEWMEKAYIKDAPGYMMLPFDSSTEEGGLILYTYRGESETPYITFGVDEDGILQSLDGLAYFGSSFISICNDNPDYFEGCKEMKGITINPTSSETKYIGTSEDDKPTNVPKYSIYLEVDTGKFYYFDGSEWNQIPFCEGGDEVFSVASVTLSVNAGEGGGALDGGINGLSEGCAFAKGYPEVSGLVTAVGVPAGESGTFYAVLASGGARYAVIGTVVSTSGDVTISEGAAIITGDCSITLDPVS